MSPVQSVSDLIAALKRRQDEALLEWKNAVGLVRSLLTERVKTYQEAIDLASEVIRHGSTIMVPGKSETVRVRQFEKTRENCPAVWEGYAEDGRPVYAHYRWGRLRVTVGGVMILNKVCGHAMDGMMDLNQLRHETRGVVEWMI